MHGDDFFALRLVSGRLLFSYDLGSGRVDIQTASYYNDGILHKVRYSYAYRINYHAADGR